MAKDFNETLMTDTTTNNLVLGYQKPSEGWTDALPVGNGWLGAMVFGGVKSAISVIESD